MSQEIIYTSAPSGLKPGSRGFCTVVATRGMAKNLADHLEDLSGYRHLFTGGATGGVNPVAYSHLKTTVGGRSYHILSRIGDAGLDYTQRTNKLAHHVALDPQELPPDGPAALLAAPGFMTSSWSGQPQVRDAGPAVPRVESLPAVCHAWQKLTGDAGWGGVLAAELAGDSRRPIVMIYRPGTDVLALIVESLALLPASKRRQATFSTYVTKLPPTIDCRWRCYVEGTPEADSAVRQAGALIIDLRKPLGSSQASPYVDAARTGKPPRVAAPSVPANAVAAAADDALLAALMEDDDVRPMEKVPTGATHQVIQEVYGVSPPPITSSSVAPRRTYKTNVKARGERQRLLLIIAGSFFLIATLGISTFLAMRSRFFDDGEKDVTSIEATNQTKNSPGLVNPTNRTPAEQDIDHGLIAPGSAVPSRQPSVAPAASTTSSVAPPKVEPAPTPSATPIPTVSTPPQLPADPPTKTPKPIATPPVDVNETRTVTTFTTVMNEPPVVVDKLLPTADQYQISLVLPTNTLDGSRVLGVETLTNRLGVQLFEASKHERDKGTTLATFAIENGQLTFDPSTALGSHNYDLLKHSILLVDCKHTEGHSTHLRYYLQKLPKVQPLSLAVFASNDTYSVRGCPRLPVAIATAKLVLTKWESLTQLSSECILSFDDKAARISIIVNEKTVLPFIVEFNYTTQDSLMVKCSIPRGELDAVLRDQVFLNENMPLSMNSIITRYGLIKIEHKKISEDMERAKRACPDVTMMPQAEKVRYEANSSRRNDLDIQLKKLTPMFNAATLIRNSKGGYLFGFSIGLDVNGEIVPMLESIRSK